jgi:hypothetical protein
MMIPNNLYLYIEDYVVGDDGFDGYDLCNLLDINCSSPDDVLADYFLGMMGYGSLVKGEGE